MKKQRYTASYDPTQRSYRIFDQDGNFLPEDLSGKQLTRILNRDLDEKETKS